MKAGKYLLPSIFVCAFSFYGSFKYAQYKKMVAEIQNIRLKNQLDDVLFNLHQSMAFHIDKVLQQYQKPTKIADYRRVLVSYCEGKILETCVGTNRNLKYYRPQSNVTFIDWSPNMIEMAMSKLNPFITTKYLVDDIRQSKFEQNTFDTVIDTFGLQYVDRPELALKEMRRICKKDGNILLLQSGLSSIVQMHYFQNYKALQQLLNCGHFSNRDWKKIIEDEKLQIVKQERKVNGTIYFYILKNNKVE